MTTHFASGGRAFALEDGALYAVTRTPLPLSRRQAAVLRYLLDNPGRQVSVAEIAGAAFGGDAPDGAVEQAVRAVMTALGDDPSAPLFIEAPSQRGYRFAGGVSGGGEAEGPAPRGARDVLGVLTEAGQPPHAAAVKPALREAESLGERRGADETYRQAAAALLRAAEAGERLPPVSLETVIDGLSGWAA